MKQSGYSGTVSAKKLGIKPGFRISLLDQPDYYYKLLTNLALKSLNPADTSVKEGS